ncbi:MAG: thioredoxin domain-containing protein [Patescibacteria group bacterium]
MEEEKREQEQPEKETAPEKKIKNLISLSILLGGLFIGSLFVDVAQMVRGGGFSPKKLSQTDIFNFGGKTWVAYSEPIVKVQVITDDSCEACKPDEIILGLHRMVPTIFTQKVDENSEEGKELIKNFGIKTIPAFVFSQDIEKTDFFNQAAAVFTKKDSSYVLKTSDLGIQPGKYIETMQVKEDDIQIGNKDSQVKIFLFSDFQCPFCKAFHESVVKKIIANYSSKVLLVFKNYPLSFHAQAENASLAGECANEQGKFIAYADKLFANQTAWGSSQGTQLFKTYASQLRLNTSQFNSCLDGKKYLDKINSDKSDGDSFGVSGTPSLFINDQFVNSASTYDAIKKIIDEDLAK